MDQGDAVGSGQGYTVCADERRVSVDGESGSCGTLDIVRRSAEQEPGGGDALDEMHGSATVRATP